MGDDTPLKEYDACETVAEAHAALAHIVGGAITVISGNHFFAESEESETETKALRDDAESKKVELARQISVMASRLRSQGHEEEAQAFKGFESSVLDIDVTSKTSIDAVVRESNRINPMAKLHAELGKKARGAK